MGGCPRFCSITSRWIGPVVLAVHHPTDGLHANGRFPHGHSTGGAFSTYPCDPAVGRRIRREAGTASGRDRQQTGRVRSTRLLRLPRPLSHLQKSRGGIYSSVSGLFLPRGPLPAFRGEGRKSLDAVRWAVPRPPFRTGPVLDAHAWPSPRMGICTLGGP